MQANFQSQKKNYIENVHKSIKTKTSLHGKRLQPLTSMHYTPIIQRKAICACNGECPVCENVPYIQTKLKISQPGDKYEKEADEISEKVINSALLTCPKCNDEKKNKSLEEILQSKSQYHHTPKITSNLETSIQSLRSSGQTLPISLQKYYGSRLNHDFGDVKIHTDIEAASIASHLNARAFTKGTHIVFGTGQYAPKTERGKKLIAHELVHVIQQKKKISDLAQKIFRICCEKENCPIPDKPGIQGKEPKKFKLTLMVQKTLNELNTGHSWVKLSDDRGEEYTYGFGPVDPGDFLTNEVDGCVYHPEKKRFKPDESYEFSNLSKGEYVAAIKHAVEICKKDNLKFSTGGYNCTTFAVSIVKAAGRTIPSKKEIVYPAKLITRIRQKKRKERKEKKEI